MFYPICTRLDRIQSFTLDLNWYGSKRVHFGKRSQTGTDRGSVPVRFQQVQWRRKAYLYPYWYGSVWIRLDPFQCKRGLSSSHSPFLFKEGHHQERYPGVNPQTTVKTCQKYLISPTIGEGGLKQNIDFFVLLCAILDAGSCMSLLMVACNFG